MPDKFKRSVPFNFGGSRFIQVGTVKNCCSFLLPWGNDREIRRGDNLINWLNEYDRNISKAVAIALRSGV